MILKAPGKINLAINVLEKRDDGYHNVDMISAEPPARPASIGILLYISIR